jgi:hypothetical protein
MRAYWRSLFFLVCVSLEARVAFKDKELKLGCRAVSPHPNPLPKGEGVKPLLCSFRLIGRVFAGALTFFIRMMVCEHRILSGNHL